MREVHTRALLCDLHCELQQSTIVQTAKGLKAKREVMQELLIIVPAISRTSPCSPNSSILSANCEPYSKSEEIIQN